MAKPNVHSGLKSLFEGKEKSGWKIQKGPTQNMLSEKEDASQLYFLWTFPWVLLPSTFLWFTFFLYVVCTTHWAKSTFYSKINISKITYIFQEIHIFKIVFLAKFSFSKSHFKTKIALSKSHFSRKFVKPIFRKNRIFKISFFTKIAFSKSTFSQKSYYFKY